MRTEVAIRMMREAMDNHPQLDNWSVGVLSRKSVAGLCDYNRKTLYLSRPYVEINSPEVVMQTIIHEIAHALLPPGSGHNSTWRRLAISLGYSPDRGATVSHMDANLPTPLWKAECRRKHYNGGMHRRPRVSYACSICVRNFNDNTSLVYTNTKTGEVFTI